MQAERQQRFLEVLLYGTDAVKAFVDGADGGQPAAEAEALHAVAVPGPDPVRDGNDGKAVALQGGGAQRGLGDADDGDVREFLQCGHARVAEGRDNDAVDGCAVHLSGVFGDDLCHGAGGDQGLKAGFDVFDAVPGGADHQFGAR